MSDDMALDELARNGLLAETMAKLLAIDRGRAHDVIREVMRGANPSEWTRFLEVMRADCRWESGYTLVVSDDREKLSNNLNRPRDINWQLAFNRGIYAQALDLHFYRERVDAECAAGEAAETGGA